MPAPLVTFTYEDVLIAARKAHAECRLGYQTYDRLMSGACIYRYDDGGCCAVGAALPQDIARKVDNTDLLRDMGFGKVSDTTIGTLLGKGVLALADPENRDALRRLQKLHDNCMTTSSDHARAEAIAEFERYIGVGSPS